MVGLLLPLAPRAQAETEVSLNFFYDNLSSQGNWIEVADYGYCFQPNVAVGNADWRPYSDGYWAYTDVGWTWVSYEDFGWATYHYGRWSNLADYGWVWVPGYEWGPAWVSWRTGGDYVGWAPLPPAGVSVYEGRAITGGVDVEFGIGPLYYNFVDLRYIGEPVLRGRILAPSRNVTIINQTVNVTNITYNNSVVYNYGPDYNGLNQYSTRPIQRLSLQRETTIGADFGQNHRGNFNRVNGNQLMVVAPQVQKSAQPIAPKQVKAKVQQPKIEHGWQGVENRQQVEAEIKNQNPKNVRPPTFQPQKDRQREAVAGTQPNEAAEGAQPAPATGADQQATTDTRRAEGERRGQDANRAEQRNDKVGRATEQGRMQNTSGEKTQEAEQRRAERAQKTQDQQAQRDEQQNSERARRTEERKSRQDERDQEQVEKRSADRDRGAEPQQPDRAQRRTGQTQESEQAERANRSGQEQESSRENRAQRGQESQDAETLRPDRDARRPEDAGRPERAQRSQDNRPPEEARAGQGQDSQSPSEKRKGKKKKPDEDNPPQP